MCFVCIKNCWGAAEPAASDINLNYCVISVAKIWKQSK